MTTHGRAGDRPEIATTPRFLSDLELTMLDLECSLLDTLSPAQFERVQELVQATRTLTAARCVLGELERRDANESTATACAERPRHRARRRPRLVSLRAVTPSAARRS